ncbi:hypothetical protein ADICYQ_1688 [Cyclobacterium qasimii M12-11B]|uniref:Uncharacterized protein n=2 Tax=Cyclobacterium qasimii TaxID=1350429 RepID=S7WZ66_9BACT|nr:hypothetical protein ADICYQ_1688 [Cyclobacterium qasimii M12-11B]GEO21012.1 hypothetical protein CQA01_15460 [Cyclobacterium qasimii]
MEEENDGCLLRLFVFVLFFGGGLSLVYANIIPIWTPLIGIIMMITGVIALFSKS